MAGGRQPCWLCALFRRAGSGQDPMEDGGRRWREDGGGRPERRPEGRPAAAPGKDGGRGRRPEGDGGGKTARGTDGGRTAADHQEGRQARRMRCSGQRDGRTEGKRRRLEGGGGKRAMAEILARTGGGKGCSRRGTSAPGEAAKNGRTQAGGGVQSWISKRGDRATSPRERFRGFLEGLGFGEPARSWDPLLEV